MIKILKQKKKLIIMIPNINTVMKIIQYLVHQLINMVIIIKVVINMVIIIKVVVNMVINDNLIFNQVYLMDLNFLIDEINEIVNMDKCI